MKVEALTQIDRDKARELWQKYRTHQNYQTPADAEIAAIYKRIAQGKTIIRALESIRVAGLNEQGLPKLAIARADEQLIHFKSWSTPTFHFNRWGHGKSKSRVIEVPGLARKKDAQGQWLEGQAVVPIIPVHLRPKRGLQNYHILWEAEWSRVYPADPYLLRRFGGDAWLVVAGWDLTEVERAVMANRLRS